MQSRSWCFTLNNYTPDEVEDLKQKDCKYIVFGHEVGEEGTPHLQGYVHFDSNKRLSALKKFQQRAHWEPAKGSHQQNFDYCTKDGKDIHERGDPPQSKQSAAAAGGAANKRRYEEAYESAKKGRLDEIPGDLMLRHYNTIKAIAKDNMPKLPSLDALDNHWFVGPSGTGKSRLARELYPDAYIKPCNKWWDGYKGEDAVIIDDFDMKHDVLAHHLKIWGDHYPFIAENKGGAVLIRPKTIIVTSNYSPDRIWMHEAESRDPIERRYKIKNF